MFDLDRLTPHGFCLSWDPGLLWLQAGSDLLIAAAYYSIPFALLRFSSLRRDLAFPWVFRLFAAFILACGTTHVLGVVTLWWPLYWVDGLLKFATALLSVTTAIVLWPLLPKALSIPSQGQLRALNARLSAEVAERRVVEERVRANEARLKSIYARTPAPLCATDAAGRVIEASDQWLELLGYGREDVIGRALTSFAVDETRGQAERHWATLWEQGSVRDVEQRLRHRDGSNRLVLTSATVECGADPRGEAVAVSAMADITVRRQTEEALQASEANLRQAQKMEAVGHLTGGIAHDFNNMLTAILCVMELLQRRLPEHDDSRKLVGSVVDVSNRAAKLTAQLLAFSRRQRLVAEPIDPAEVVDDMRGLLTQAVGEQVELTLMPGPPHGWLALADRNQLESALLNLVLNAKAAVAGKGAITIASKPVECGEVVLDPDAGEDTLPARDYVAITVSDTGCGMDEETRRRAFEPFFTTKAVGQGSGLGLSQTYGFVRQSGGTVQIESEPGRGTAVTILLPRAADGGERRQRSNASTPPRTAQGETVLLVEDEDTLREVVVAGLEAQGYNVVAARSGDEAMEIASQGVGFDVLFTDIVMPGRRNGVDLARELRSKRPDLPVLFATGYSDRRVLERWPGRAEIVGKPYSIDAVARAIQAMREAALA